MTAILDLARTGNRAFEHAQPWKTRKEDPERCALDLGAALELVHALSVLLLPFLPESARKLQAAFPDTADVGQLGSTILTPGRTIEPPGILFPRLE